MTGAPSLARRFALSALVAVVFTAASTMYVVEGIFMKVERADVAAHVQLVGKVVLAPRLRSSDFGHPTPARRAALARLFRSDVLSGTTVAASLFRPDGSLAFSTDAGTTPSSFAAEAVRRSQISSDVARAVVGQRARKVVAYALPVRFVRAGAAGVVVLTVDYDTLTHAARRATIPISVALVLLILTLFVGLAPAVRRAIVQTRKHVRAAESYALRDTLTGLPNRRLFDDRIAQTIAQAHRDGSTAAVMLIDLDRFKEINDTHGHAAGDTFLRETAIRLTEVLRDCDTVARLGGDEFAAVLPDATLNSVHETATRMREAVEAPLEHDGVTLSVGASIGVAVFPDHGASPGALLREADLAMYQAKRAGLGHVVFEPGSDRRRSEADTLASELVGALDRGEITLHYQPTVVAETLDVVGFEALLRWKHPLKGHLAADRFVSLADRTGVKRRLYEHALAEAVCQAGAWGRSGVATTVALNIDACMLVDRTLPGRLERLLDEHDVDAVQLEAEIAETALLGDVGRITAGAIELAALGVVLVVDGFGADHTSLNTLAYLPIEKLKLHRTMLTRAVDSARERIVLAGVVELAHNLGLSVVAEGVESEDDLELVRALGVDFAQGYLLGAPAPASSVDRLLGAAA